MRGGPTLLSGMLSGDIQIGWTASSRKMGTKGFVTLADLSQDNIPHHEPSDGGQEKLSSAPAGDRRKVLRALIESLAFTWAPKSKSAVLKSVMRLLRITDIGFAEDGYQDFTHSRRAGQKTSSSLEGVRNVQRLMQSSNPRVGEIKLEEIIDRSIVRNSMTAASSTDCTVFMRKVIVSPGLIATEWHSLPSTTQVRTRRLCANISERHQA